MKPMLAATVEDVAKLTFPLMASPKLDGIRCIIQDRRPVSRNFKAIPNGHIFDTLYDMNLPPLDGELIVGNPKAADCFNRSTSGVMGREGCPKFGYYVFDRHDKPSDSFRQRITEVSGIVRDMGGALRIVAHKEIRDVEALLKYEAQMLLSGMEGVMLRHPNGGYKFGRSTMREGLLMKLKRFSDGEARIVGFVEQEHNGNAATKDELGRTKRSSAKGGKTGKGTLGALQVEDLVTGVAFEIGTGFDDAMRARVWADRPGHRGKVVKYKHQAVGAMDKPRFPVFLGFRDAIDI